MNPSTLVRAFDRRLKGRIERTSSRIARHYLWLRRRRRMPRFLLFRLQRPRPIRIYSDWVTGYPKDRRAFVLSMSGGVGLQPKLIEQFASFHDLNGLFVDVGANLGEWTAALRTSFGRVVAVEADKELCDVLRTTFAAAPNVSVVCKAVADSDGVANLYGYSSYRGGQSLFPSFIHGLDRERWWGIGSPVVKRVETLRLATYLQNSGLLHKISGFYMKLDVEGSEHLVLKDMLPLLESSERWAVCVEFNAALIHSIGEDPLVLWRLLISLDPDGTVYFNDGSSHPVSHFSDTDFPRGNCDVIVTSVRRGP